jgi:hypothetical protein
MDALAYGHSARRLITLSVMLNDPYSVHKEITVEIQLRFYVRMTVHLL